MARATSGPCARTLSSIRTASSVTSKAATALSILIPRSRFAWICTRSKRASDGWLLLLTLPTKCSVLSFSRRARLPRRAANSTAPQPNLSPLGFPVFPVSISDRQLDFGRGGYAGTTERGLVDYGAVGPLRGRDVVDLAAQVGEVQAVLHFDFV